jgi:hypothetical protein
VELFQAVQLSMGNRYERRQWMVANQLHQQLRPYLIGNAVMWAIPCLKIQEFYQNLFLKRMHPITSQFLPELDLANTLDDSGNVPFTQPR